jgi:two-component system CheB/CheR fusion protein
MKPFDVLLPERPPSTPPGWLRRVLFLEVGRFWRLPLAVVVLGSVLACESLSLVPELGLAAPHILVSLPVVLAAWYCGLEVGLGVVVVGGLAVWFLSGHTAGEVPVTTRGALVACYLVAHAVVVVVVSTGRSSLRLARAKLEWTARTHREVLGVIESIPHVFFSCDPSGRVGYANEGWFRFTGTSPDEFGPDPVEGARRVLHPDDFDAAVRLYSEAMRTGVGYAHEQRLRRYDGQYVWFVCRLAPVTDETGAVVRWYGTLTDIDHQKRLIERLEETEAELRAKVVALRREAKHRDDFCVTLGHELRNPLGPLLYNVRLLEGVRDWAVVDKCRQQIERYLDLFRRLVGDLLDVTRLKRGQMSLKRERVDVREVVERAVGIVQPATETRRHTIVCPTSDEPCVVYADPLRLQQVVVNLLHNAVKYTDPGGSVSVGLACDGREAVLRVRDTGIGMTPEVKANMFDMFAQAEKPTDERFGLGIGLTLAKRLVEAHGGTISGHSDGPNTGSEFVVRLPVFDGGPSNTAVAVPASAEPAEPLDVLVVDDNADAADSLAAVVRLAGHRACVTYDGETGLTAADGRPFDVALIDLGLPRINGLTVGKRLRQRFGDRITVIAVTGYGSDEDRKHTAKAGFDHHLLKPVDPKAILPLIRRTAGRAAPPD